MSATKRLTRSERAALRHQKSFEHREPSAKKVMFNDNSCDLCCQVKEGWMHKLGRSNVCDECYTANKGFRKEPEPQRVVHHEHHFERRPTEISCIQALWTIICTIFRVLAVMAGIILIYTCISAVYAFVGIFWVFVWVIVTKRVWCLFF